MKAKNARQLRREVDAFLRTHERAPTRPTRHHASKLSPKEQLIAILMQGHQDIAHDLLLERGVLHTGIVMDISTWDPKGPIMTIGVKRADLNMREHGKLMDMRRYWMFSPQSDSNPEPGDRIDFTVTHGSPPKTKSLKQQLHLLPNFTDMSESQIRAWVNEWWV